MGVPRGITEIDKRGEARRGRDGGISPNPKGGL